MIVIDKNRFGTLQQSSAYYRIVRGGDGLVCYYHGNFDKVKKYFDKLGSIRVGYATKACVDLVSKRMDDAYENWLESIGRVDSKGNTLAWSYLAGGKKIEQRYDRSY